MRKIAIFDFDGTLSDSFPWFVSNINSVARIFNFKQISNQEIELLRSKDSAEIIRYLRISTWKLPFIIWYMKRLMGRSVTSIHLFKDVENLLRSLNHNGIELIVLSSNSEKNVKDVLGLLSEHVSAYYCSAGLDSKNKSFRRLKNDFGDDCQFLSIGDEPRDFLAASKLSIPHISVTWGYSSAQKLSLMNPVHSIEELEVRILSFFK